MPDKVTYEILLANLVGECKWPEEKANQFILETVKDEEIRNKARAALTKEEKAKSSLENKARAITPENYDEPIFKPENNPKVNFKVNNMPKKVKKFKLIHKVAAVIMTISIAGLAVMSPGIIQKLDEYSVNEQLNDEIASIVITDDAYTVDSTTDDVVTNFKDVDFDALKQINSDIVGWLEWEGTNIDYPVVQGTDNDYYLHHAIDGTANSAGTLFMDKDNSSGFSDDVTVIFGHNMKNDSMFGSLSELQDQEFYNEHPTMYYHTEDAIYEINLFAAVNQDFTTLTYGNYNDTSEFVNDMNNIKNLSTFQSDVQIDEDSQVLVLSTCLDSGSNGTNNRFLVYGTVQKVLDKTLDNSISMGRQI